MKFSEVCEVVKFRQYMEICNIIEQVKSNYSYREYTINDMEQLVKTKNNYKIMILCDTIKLDFADLVPENHLMVQEKFDTWRKSWQDYIDNLSELRYRELLDEETKFYRSGGILGDFYSFDQEKKELDEFMAM